MLAIAFVLETPWDLGVPDDYVLPSWRDPDKGGVNQPEPPNFLGPPPSSGHSLTCWLRFRTVKVETQRPLAASDLAFGSLDADQSRGRTRKYLRAINARIIMSHPFRARRTVVLAYVPSTTLEELSDEDFTRKLLTALSVLNAWLISLGVLQDDRLRPLSLGDLPPAIPTMPVTVDGDTARHGASRPLVLRQVEENLRTYENDELEQAQRMLAIVSSDSGLSSFYELVQRAGSARRADRHREAVIDYATAGELFITEMLRAICELRSFEPSRILNLVSGVFKDRVLHLCRQLGFSDNPEDPESPLFFWWLHCYLQRNRLVHEGADSFGMLSEAARMGLVTLVVGIREAVRDDDELAELAATIQWGWKVDETGEGGSSFPEPL